MELKDPSGRCFCRTLGPKLQSGTVSAAPPEPSGAASVRLASEEETSGRDAPLLGSSSQCPGIFIPTTPNCCNAHNKVSQNNLSSYNFFFYLKGFPPDREGACV